MEMQDIVWFLLLERKYIDTTMKLIIIATDMNIVTSHQGGPHNHAIAGIAVAMKQAKSEEFKTYQKQVGPVDKSSTLSFSPICHGSFFLSSSVKVVKNAQRLAEGLIKLG